jgi:hypothetical protein
MMARDLQNFSLRNFTQRELEWEQFRLNQLWPRDYEREQEVEDEIERRGYIGYGVSP